MDFVSDELYDGRRIRILTIVDNFTRESLCASADFRFKGVDVANALDVANQRHGKLEQIKVDNGRESSWKEDYNKERPHSSLGDKTPEEFAAFQEKAVIV